MPTSYTEARRSAEFIISEANFKRSRESGTVVSGQTLVAGQVVMDNGAGKMTAHDGLLNTAGEVLTAAMGIVMEAVDASGGDVTNVVYIARDAEVNQNIVTYPTESTAGGEQAGVNASLAGLGIIARS